jgi:hypothetical protein
LFKNRWEVIEEHAQGDGQFDAFMNALAKIYKSKELQLPKLIDYAVRIHQEVVLMHYVKPLLLGLIMEKNLKLEDWILIRQ